MTQDMQAGLDQASLSGCGQWEETEPQCHGPAPPHTPNFVFTCPAAHCSPGTVHSDHSPAFLLGLLASVPSCVEDLSNPVAEPSSQQAGSMSSAGE